MSRLSWKASRLVRCVPVTFSGLRCGQGSVLFRISDGKRARVDQSVHGGDRRQCDYDPSTRAYALTFSLPLGRWSGGERVRLRLETPAGD